MISLVVVFCLCSQKQRTVYKLQSNAARYQVQNVEDMLDKIYPKLKDIKFNTIKQNHFLLPLQSKAKGKNY